MKTLLRNAATIGGMIVLSAACLLPGLALIQGCTTSQQRIAFNTIGSLETTTTAAVDGYFLAVAKGGVSTNGVPAVSRDYNKFQGGVLVALDIVQNNTNALAPASLQQLSTDLISEIGQFRGEK